MDLQFERFMQFCEGYLDDSTKKLLTLVKKRYHECDEEYKQSQEFLRYILCAEAKIDSDESNFFVHLRDFLNILKDNKARVDNGYENQGRDPGRSKRGHESSESECSAKRRKTHENEKTLSEHETKTGKNIVCDQRMGRAKNSSENAIPVKSLRLDGSEHSLEDNNSDQEMKIAPDTAVHDADKDQMQGNHDATAEELFESGGMAEGDSDVAEHEDEKKEKSEKRKKQRNSKYLSDLGKIVVQENDEKVRETSGICKARSYKNAIKEINAMFSSSEDENNEEDIRTATDIENIIQEQDGEKFLCYSPEENERCTNEEVDEKSESGELKAGTNNYFRSLKKADKGPGESDTSEHVAVSNECLDILDISSETEENVKHDLVEQKSKPNKEESSKNCSEIGSCTDQDSRNEKWDNGEVLFIENEEKPLCFTIKHVKGTKPKESIAENLDLKHDLVNKEEIKRKSAKLNSSGEVHIIDYEESESNHDDDVLMGDTTKEFGDQLESELDDKGTDAEESEEVDEDKVLHKASEVNGKNKELSSDDEDSFDAVKAKKFREKCKKKYVVSVGKKKNREFSSPSNDHLKPTFINKTEKDRSPRKKRTPNSSPKCKKKSSPNKSPIIIFTDSESDSDVDDMEGFKKKFDEKARKRFQMQDNSSIVIEKISTKVEPMEADHVIANGTDGKNHKHGLMKDNSHNATDSDRSYDSDNKKSSKVKEIKEKKRVSLITEEHYSNKYDRDDGVSKQHKEKTSDRHKEIDVKDKLKHKSEERSGKESVNKHEQDHDNEQPGPSSASDGDSAKKKGSTRQIRKLEALLESIRNKIETVRERELDLDEMDSEVSDYILEDRLQRKFMKVWDKLCELHKAVKSTGRPTDKYFRYQGTRYPDINRKLEKFINKKKVFPDYHDVRSIIMKVNKEKRLHLKSREMDDLAREAFTDVGNQLQRRRQKDFISTFHSSGVAVNPFSLYDDPALYDPELKKKLDANKKSAKSNMEKVVEKYAALQYQVDDKTDDEGDEEEEEEEEEDNNIEELDQLTGVDNSDSDNNTDDEHIVSAGGKSSSKTWDTGPCLEIDVRRNRCLKLVSKRENLESGKKTSFSTENPDDVDKLCFMKSRVKEEISGRDPQEKHFSEQLGLCRSSSKDDKKQIGMTVTILSDNDDDNEVKCFEDGEKDGLNDTSNKLLSIDSDDSQNMNIRITESSKDHGSNSEKIDDEIVETKVNVQKMSEVSNITVITDDDNKDLGSSSENIDNEVVETEANAQKMNEVSNITIITDDEEEEENLSDQSLGLKIVSTQHVSLSDISKLHGEEDSDVVEEVKELGSNESEDFKESLNSSGESGSESVKFQLEVEQVENKTEMPVTKEKVIEVKEFSDVNKKISDEINEVLISEPEVMIIEDTETEVLPSLNKSFNVKMQNRNPTQKSKCAPNYAQRSQSGSYNANGVPDGKVKVTSPSKSHSNTMYPVPDKSWDVQTEKVKNAATKTTSANRFIGGSSKVTSPVKTNSSTMTPVINKGWNIQPKKLAENVNISNREQKCTQKFPSNLSNTNSFTSASYSSTMYPMSNNTWNVQQQKLGKRNNSNNMCSKQFSTLTNENSKGTRLLKSSPYSVYPAANKGWNVQSQEQGYYVKKSYKTSQCTQRFPSSSSNLNFAGSSSKLTFPTKTNSSTMYAVSNKGKNVQGQNLGNNIKRSGSSFVGTQNVASSTKQANKITSDHSKITSPSKVKSKTMSDVVVIDCDETEQITTKPSKRAKTKTNSVLKLESTNEIICLDDAENMEAPSRLAETKPFVKHTHNMPKSNPESNNVCNVKTTNLKASRNSSSSSSSPKTKEISKESDIEVSETEESPTPKTKIEMSKCKDADKMPHEVSSSIVKGRNEENNRSSNLKETDEVVEIKEKSNENTSEEAGNSGVETKQNVPEVSEGRISPPDIFAGSFGTVESNEYGSIESCHDSEVFENPEVPDEEQNEALPVDENVESQMEESPSVEIFTATRLEAGVLNETVESSIDDTVEELSTSGQEPGKLNDKTVVANEESEFENKMKSSISEKFTLAGTRKDKETNSESEENVKTQANVILNATLTVDTNPASDDEQEVSGGFEDEEKISSTSCDIESFPKVNLIRNKLLQLKKAIVNSKPQAEVKSQAQSQDTTGLSKSPGSAQWIEEDENASLIETYQEPDSTPYSLAENLISSSSNENIIVLSDSE
ncbi:uncharacterized protein LOC123526107 isoform X2 [Mercenaria mercenaria]|uniref:uncharacterized protein LOC123526107 isoform X2 n=1 Tax=Mercenaria mercenaria TaxID=6596 RepID=UPI00234FAD3F|nr:uncharacterized protein LOC123526107 isoform X2 [Mercenaria mercenaria]